MKDKESKEGNNMFETILNRIKEREKEGDTRTVIYEGMKVTREGDALNLKPERWVKFMGYTVTSDYELEEVVSLVKKLYSYM